jgi:hypothetical protein
MRSEELPNFGVSQVAMAFIDEVTAHPHSLIINHLKRYCDSSTRWLHPQVSSDIAHINNNSIAIHNTLLLTTWCHTPRSNQQPLHLGPCTFGDWPLWAPCGPEMDSLRDGCIKGCEYGVYSHGGENPFASIRSYVRFDGRRWFPVGIGREHFFSALSKTLSHLGNTHITHLSALKPSTAHTWERFLPYQRPPSI